MIYIIIPVFNRKDYTRKCLESLRKQSFKDFKIVVVDDGSTDGTSDMLAKDFPEVIVLTGDGNLWWTASINLGVKKALAEGASYVLTLNNDTIAPENFLEKMVYWSEIHPQALLGAMALDSGSKQPIYGGGTINWMTASFHSLLDKLSPDEWKGLHPVDHFPGRGLLIPKEVFEKIGLFNQKTFPHYIADFDFSHQAVMHGFQLYCNYDAPLYTFPEESGDRENRRKKTLKKYYSHLFGIKGGGNIKNFTFFAHRNCPPYYLPIYLTVGYVRRIFGYLLK